jgi:hypothetical protein
MRSIFGFVSTLLVLMIGYFAYTSFFQTTAPDGKPLVQEISLVRVKNDLLSLAQAERFYLASNGTYGTLDELRAGGSPISLPNEDRRGYSYELEKDGGAHFRVIARPAEAVSGLPVISIDETMQIKEEPASGSGKQ